MRKVIYLIFMFIATDAAACERRVYGRDLTAQVQAGFDYLICLLNEQNAKINTLSDEVLRLQNKVTDLEQINAISSSPIVQKRTPAEQREIDENFAKMNKMISDLNHPTMLQVAPH